VLLLSTDVNGRITHWAAEAASCFGFDESEAVGRGLHTLFRPSDATGFYADLAASRRSTPVEWTYYHKENGRQSGTFTVQAVEPGSLAVGLIKDVSGSSATVAITPPAAAAPVEPAPPASGKLAPEELDRERLMMSESHHRVKNHLQIVTSMLNLQMSTLRNEEARDALRSSQNRIRSIASLHQHLYHLAAGEGGSFEDFATGLVGHLRECYGVPETRVPLQLKTPRQAVPDEWLMPLALALNEMVSNSFRHGFSEGRAGMIQVELSWDDQRGHLIVRDNGAGMAGDFDDLRSNGLGMKILRVFAGQLGGEVKIQNESKGGVTFHLDFPALPAQGKQG
jgi:two-component sensor histidine kinase